MPEPPENPRKGGCCGGRELGMGKKEPIEAIEAIEPCRHMGLSPRRYGSRGSEAGILTLSVDITR